MRITQVTYRRVYNLGNASVGLAQRKAGSA